MRVALQHLTISAGASQTVYGDWIPVENQRMTPGEIVSHVRVNSVSGTSAGVVATIEHTDRLLANQAAATADVLAFIANASQTAAGVDQDITVEAATTADTPMRWVRSKLAFSVTGTGSIDVEHVMLWH